MKAVGGIFCGIGPIVSDRKILLIRIRTSEINATGKLHSGFANRRSEICINKMFGTFIGAPGISIKAIAAFHRVINIQPVNVVIVVQNIKSCFPIYQFIANASLETFLGIWENKI